MRASAVGRVEKTLDRYAAAFEFDIHGGAGELPHQARRHGLAVVHGQDQALAVGRHRCAGSGIDHVAEYAGAKIKER